MNSTIREIGIVRITINVARHLPRKKSTTRMTNIPANINVNIAIALWDADRLDLARFHEYRPVKATYLSSEFAKILVNTMEHYEIYS